MVYKINKLKVLREGGKISDIEFYKAKNNNKSIQTDRRKKRKLYEGNELEFIYKDCDKGSFREFEKLLLEKIQDVKIEYPVEINMVFANIPLNIRDKLIKNGVKFNPWYGDADSTRFVTSWDTEESELEKLEKIINNI